MTGRRSVVTVAPVGYLAATTDYSTWQGARFAHMDCLFVLEQHRRHGIGRRLRAP